MLQWLAPAPLWDEQAVGVGASGLTQPWIAEIADDRFVDAFAGILAGGTASPAAGLAATRPAVTTDGTAAAPYRLFQPLSMRHYLVVATLVCRRPGIPDHTVLLPRGERAFFVMRRLVGTGEEAYLPGTGGAPGSWVAADAGVLVPGEQENPMHAAPVTPYADQGSTAAALGLALDGGPGRRVWFGYVPVGIRESLVLPMADPLQALADLQEGLPDSKVENPTIDALFARVVQPWQHLRYDAPDPPNVDYASLFLLLDLADWLRVNVATVFAAVRSGATSVSDADDNALLQELRTTSVGSSGGNVTVAQALKDTEPYLTLLTGEDVTGPSTTYDLRGADQSTTLPLIGKAPSGGTLVTRARTALGDRPPVLPPELEGMIQEPPPSDEDGSGGSVGSGPTYVIRTVLVHDPCVPVLSAASHPFELARAMDADAPARKILLQMPDIRHMRGFQRGVAIEMPPALRRVMDRITPDTIKGELGAASGLDLGMICAFSLQIIFLVAFIVMFIFLIILNIIFWWMPFLKICFPIPVPESPSKGPTP